MISQGRLIATTASQVLLPDNTTRHGFLVKSIATNTDRIFLGFVDAQSATTGGMPLEPGESQFFGTEYPVISAPEWNSAVQVIANSGTQDVRWVEF